MDTLRHWFAVLITVSLIPAVAYWYVIHPFAGFWRRRGVRVTYATIGVMYLALIAAAWVWRDALIGRDLGTNRVTIVIGLACYTLNMVIERACRRHLTFRILSGRPEIEGVSGTQKLLREGIYNRVRHPRYLGLLIGCVGWSLIVNHVGSYAFTAMFSILLYGVILLEERELRERFGEEYRAYMREVPRLLPSRVGQGFRTTRHGR